MDQRGVSELLANEREALAKRLHAGPVQDLTAAQLLIDATLLRIGQHGFDEQAHATLQRLHATLQAATRSCRRLMADLESADAGEGGARVEDP